MKYAHPASEIQQDRFDPARPRTFQIALERDADVEQNSPLPPFFHQLYFWSPSPPYDLGRDGHPRVGTGLIPDMGLSRRIWAGGRLGFARDLLAGVDAERYSIVEKAEHKHGRCGPLAFVTIRHEYHQHGNVCLTEWQDLVYRQDPEADAPQPVARRHGRTKAKYASWSSAPPFCFDIPH